MQDSLYLDDKLLLRTHNTGISARILEKNKNKAFSQFAIGKVYRNDEEDQTHSHQFTQLDLVSVGLHSFATLIYTLKEMLSYVFEQEIKIRLRPSYFPFTEPSVEVSFARMKLQLGTILVAKHQFILPDSTNEHLIKVEIVPKDSENYLYFFANKSIELL